MNEEFYALFGNFSKSKVNLAIERLRKKDRDFICEYYGIKGFYKLSIGELSQKYGITASGVRNKRKYCVDKIFNILMHPKDVYNNNEKFYQLYSEYEKQDVLYALEYLTPRCRRVLELYYGLNCNDEMDMKDIANEFGIDINSVNSALIYGTERILNILEDLKCFQSSLEIFSHAFSKVEENLSDVDKKIIDIYYNSSSVERFFYKVVSDFSVNYNEAKSMINGCIKNVKKEIQKINKSNKNNVLFCELFGDYKWEEINATLDIFGEKRKEIISRYYGINGYNCTEMKDIAKILDVSVSWVSYSIRRDSEKLKFLLKYPNEISLKKRFIKDFSKHEKELVEKLLIKFSPLHQQILSESYGFKGYKVLTREKLCDKYNINDDSLDKILNASVKKIKSMLEDGRFNDKFLKYEASDFMSYLDFLSNEERAIVVRYYGLLGYNEQNIDEIAENLNIDPVGIGVIIEDIEKNMETNLSNLEFLSRKKKNRNLFLNELLTKDKIKVKKAMSLLTEKEEKVLEMYYGLDSFCRSSNDEIAFLLKINEDEVKELVDSIIEKINDNLYNIYYNNNKVNK